MSKSAEAFVSKIKELHPDFEYRLWGNEEITPGNFSNFELIISRPKHAQKADIMRYEILYRHGGIYLDIDMEVFQPLSPLLTNALIVCNEDGKINEYMSIGFIASEPNNSMLATCVQSIKSTDWSKTINVATGPFFFRRCIKLDASVRVLPTHFCYPTHWSNKAAIPKITHETFMHHHWDKNW